MGKLVLNPGQMPHHSLSGLDVILARDGNLFHGLEKSKPILHRLSQSLIAPLKQMPPKVVPAVEPLRVGTLQPFYSYHQVWFRSLQQQLVMLINTNA
jgi:hypothetical protein